LLYLEYIPAAPLSRYVRMLWYTRAPGIAHRRERILPNGCVQVIVNLAREFLLDCDENGQTSRMPPALVVGARSIYEIVDTSDMEELVGVVFRPGGFGRFAGDAVDRFHNRNVGLEEIWGRSARQVRDRLRELDHPAKPAMGHPMNRLRCLERLLYERLNASGQPAESSRSAVVAFALRRFAENPGLCTVREVARGTGWSERRFSQVFREEVGFGPKAWCRIQRFQRAVKALHTGREVRWAELALDCGFYDQSHFANEFRAFSGINATTYSAERTRWANHQVAK
jgi:AraC-like DNA-binding protein